MRVLGETFDGALVIDGDVADDDQDDRADLAGEDDAADTHRSLTKTLANQAVPMTPVRGYLPADDAMAQAAEANRAHRY